jgi:hypothetical protein
LPLVQLLFKGLHILFIFCWLFFHELINFFLTCLSTLFNRLLVVFVGVESDVAQVQPVLISKYDCKQNLAVGLTV